MNSKIIISFDYGIKNIGLAVGQLITRNSYPLKTIQAKYGVPNWLEIECLLNKWQPLFLVIGLPINMDGTEQPLTNKTRKFANCLYKKFGIQYKYQDERLSTVEAKEIIFQNGGYRALKNKNKINSYAAAIILKYWFNEDINNKK